MSGLEVVAAVAAVVSAFHGGAELLKHVRRKREARKVGSSAQQEWEEERLQASLMAGEQQIGQNYDRDQRELGDLVRIGDDIARERLYHITLMLQAEIINSLKQAATSEVCKLDVRFLHKASNTKRRETLTALEELKQRIYLRRPMARQLQCLAGESRPCQWRLSSPPAQANSHESTHLVPDEYASHPPHVDYRQKTHGPTPNYPSLNSRDALRPPLPAYEPAQSTDPDLSKALQLLPPDHRAAVIRDIQQMIVSYQQLGFDSGAHQQQSHRCNESCSRRHEPNSAPSDRNVSETIVTDFDKETCHQLHQNTRAASDQDAGHSATPLVFNQDMFGLETKQPEYLRPYPPIQIRAQRQPRWSESSGASSAQSNFASLDRNSSSSSQRSSNPAPRAPSRQSLPSDHGRVALAPATLDESCQQDDQDYRKSSSLYADSEDEYTPPTIAPLALSRNQPRASPNDWSRETRITHATPTTVHTGGDLPVHQQPWCGVQPNLSSPPDTQYTVEITANHVPRSTPTHHRTLSSLSALATAAAVLSPKKLTRTNSVNRSLRSQTSTSSGSTRSAPTSLVPCRRIPDMRRDTIHSGPVRSDAMMNGRPDKQNDYWGFCKGAWAVREDVAKGLCVRAQPCGYYATKHLWACKTCAFSGPVFKAPHPTKKKKSVDIVDPRVKISRAGIRYRWVFLAKSHVRKKSAAPSAAVAVVTDASAAAAAAADDNFGCIFCCLGDTATGVYGGVETLMNHIAHVHVAGMSEQVRRKANCILGRVASSDEEFDINVPFSGPG